MLIVPKPTHSRPVWKIKQVRHDFVSEIVVAVGEQEYFGARLTYSCQDHWKTNVLFHVVVQVLKKRQLVFC